ncbi:MAG: class I SAM-dependent methyltransferase [Pseudomonadota bacterium]
MSDRSEPESYLLGDQKGSYLRYRLFNEIYEPGTIRRLSDLAVSPDMEILDIGCGIGDTACYFARHIVPDGHVTAFDQAPELIEVARRQAAEHEIGNVTFICASAQEFPFPTERFDFAHTRYVLTYLSQAVEVLKETHRALKPSGFFLGEEIAQTYIRHGRAGWYDQLIAWFTKLIETGGGDPDYGHNGLPSDLLDAGFTDLDVSAFWPFEDQQKIVDMLRIALSSEMKETIVSMGLAAEEVVEAVIAELAMPQRDYRISPSMCVQVVGWKRPV